MVRVKICGITSWQDAKLALDAGADILGFNFYPPSPRYISPAQAKRIAARLPRGRQAAGVFVNEPVARMEQIAGVVGLDLLQLHGNESPEQVRELAERYPVIKAFRIRRGFRCALLARYADAAAFLLDGFRRRLHGGTGRTFDWHIAKAAKRYGRIFLAGGLTPENVAQAIREVRPYAVDVCSGVETRPGKKDPGRLRELMRQVEAAHRRLA